MILDRSLHRSLTGCWVWLCRDQLPTPFGLKQVTVGNNHSQGQKPLKSHTQQEGEKRERMIVGGVVVIDQQLAAPPCSNDNH